ncbi:glycoside hydrolase family 15 protein [Streptomyces sp. x-45]|uniref:glycoside hydrolase family 15 protein n=1 Tax=Streptomyces sp. x-45 TaxID=2789281 RepID=UPI0022C79CAD|nr:glycoside hydrolase family 15 protein [Streptomyces diastatochromogenes]
MDGIQDHAYVGNMRTGALVGRDGRVSWMALPRFDSRAHFTSILGTEEHGLWRIGPISPDGTTPAADRRRYLDNTLILESVWTTEAGTVKVLDFMPTTGEAAQLVRIVEGVAGRVTMHSVLRARTDYGRTTPQLVFSGRRVSATLDEGRLWLDADVHLGARGDDLFSQFTVSEGEQVAFTLSWQPDQTTPPPLPAPAALLRQTTAFWTTWASHCTYTGARRDDVIRSLIPLKALIYEPTGAMVAAASVSLPEEIGGIRNWSYVYCWLRDSAFAAERLAQFGYGQEVEAWIDWVTAVIGGDFDNLQIMYGVGGERDLVEEELDWLPGHAGSRPVRIGNGAAGQLQLDVFGEVVDALAKAQQHYPHLTPKVTPLISGLVGCVEKLWRKPDMGIWEVRGPRRHFVHSKIMAWTAVDRAVQLVETGHMDGPLEHWRALRDTIHRDVCEKGYDKERNTFTQSYGSTELDAALLHALLSGFLPADDKRVIGTIEAVQQDLSIKGGYLLRYRTSGNVPGVDGLTGHEATFLIGLGWLIVALGRIGRTSEAENLTEALLRARNDVGLLSEEWDPHAEQQLGNFPQAFSHIAVLMALAAAFTGAEPETVEVAVR